MSEHLDHRSGSWSNRVGAPVRALVVIVVAAGLVSCSGSAPPEDAVDAAAAQRQEDARALASLQEDAERHFAAGERAYREGRYREARAQFKAALDVYLEAEVRDGQRQALQSSFNEMFNRIHVLGLEELVPTEEQLVSLPEELLPPPNEEELARLRERLEASLPELPELPEFTMPVPDPLDNERVLWAIEYLSTERKEIIEEGLSRATRYMPMILEVLEDVGVPPEIAWVPLIESLYKPNAYSRARAMGMWQFMSGTARLYGLRVDYTVDERKDPVRATRTAAIYLKDLYNELGSWDLALAAYNWGKGNVQRAMRRSGTDDYWALARSRYMPRETRDFVPKIYAAMHLGADPERYGLHVEPQPLFEYDEVEIDSMTDVRVLAEAAGSELSVIQDLNPHINGVTPRVDRYTVRVPKGRGEAFSAAYAAIPEEERVQFIEYRVKRGDTLSEIAAGHNTTVAAIRDMNRIRNDRRLQIGQRLIIPLGHNSGRFFTTRPLSGYSQGERVSYTVQRGDTLTQIASMFATTVLDLMRWNDLESSSLIFPGTPLVAYYGVRGGDPAAAVASTAGARSDAGNGGGPSSGGSDGSNRGGHRGIYTVRAGDSLYVIAQRFDVSVDDLKRWNNRRGNTIYPGDKLTLWSDTPIFDDSGVVVERGGAIYIVRRGDNATTIARRLGVDLDALLRANGLGRDSTIHPGDELVLPGGPAPAPPSRYTVRRGDTLSDIASSFGIPLSLLLEANGLTRRSTIFPGDTLVIPRR